MVHCTSETMGSCMEKPTGTKRSGTRKCICDIVAYQVNIRQFQDTLWMRCHHPLHLATSLCKLAYVHV